MSDLTVLQSVKRWLPRTQKWLHRQVSSLPDDIQSRVACRESLNLDDFPVAELDTFDERTHGFAPIDWLLALGRDLPVVADRIEQWERRRWIERRSEFGEGTDIIHSHFGHIGWRDIDVARRLGARHVTTFYGYDCSLLPAQDDIWQKRYPDLFDRVDLVLCEGPHMKQKVADLGCEPDKIAVHHLGVDVDSLEFRVRTRDDEPTDSQAEHKEGRRPVRFLIASSFKPKKGIPDAIEALGRLKDEIDFELTLVGDATYVDRTQQEKREIDATIDEFGLADRIERRGFVPYDELIDEFLKHDVLVAPSRTSFRGDSEGGAPVTMIAAQATGMPVVSTTHADIPNVVIDGETGYLSPERDVDALQDNLRYVAQHSEQWEPLGRRAREHVESEFNAEIQSQRLAKHYRSLVEQSAQGEVNG